MNFQGISFPGMLILFSVLVVCAPVVAPAADKEVVELQRDVALVGDQVNTLQTTVNTVQTAVNTLQATVNEKLGAQGALIQQALDHVNQIHTENAVRANAVSDQLGQQEQKLAAPMASLNAKLDQMISQLAATQENVAETNSRLGLLEQRIVDLESAVKVIQAPPPTPPPPQEPGGPPAGVSALGLFQNATRDQLSGNSDLALQSIAITLSILATRRWPLLNFISVNFAGSG